MSTRVSDVKTFTRSAQLAEELDRRSSVLVRAPISQARTVSPRRAIRNNERARPSPLLGYPYRVLRGVLDYAVKHRHIAVNPAFGVDLPRKVTLERRYLNYRQVEDLAAAMGEWRVLTLVLAYTGLRWGEAVALRVRRINLKHGRIEVADHVTRVGLELVVGPRKSHAHLSVPAPAFLVDELRPVLEELEDDDLVLKSPIGGHLMSVHLFIDDLDHLATNLGETRAYSLRNEGAKRKVVPIRKTV